MPVRGRGRLGRRAGYLAVAVVSVVALVAVGLGWGPWRWQSEEDATPADTPSSVGPTSCTNSDGSPCPASYFTGPLGANNVLPTRTGALLIEQYGGIGTSWPRKQAGISERQRSTGRGFDGIQVQYGGSTAWGGIRGMEDPTQMRPPQERWAIDNGASFVAVSWTPDFTIGEMNSGAADPIWAKAANYWKTYAPTRIMLRSFVEFNVPQTAGAVPGVENGDADYCGAPFRDAWRRMVDVFQKNGASNVGFWFTPDEGNNRQCVKDSYPGDRYVDWVGSDTYNECAVADQSCYATPLHPGWSTFGELFDYRGECADGACPRSQYDLFGPRKPFVVGETGTVYDWANPSRKGDFYRSMVTAAKSMKYLRGVSLFDQNVSAAEGADSNWLVDMPTSNPSVYDGFKQLARDPWFNTRTRASN